MSAKTSHPTDKHVGSRVRMRRMTLGMTQERLGDELGLTFQQVQKYEKGTNRISASRLQHLSKILGVPVPFFFEGVPNAPHSTHRSEAPSTRYVTDFLANHQGHALVRAFVQIKNPVVRRAIVRMVETLVADKDS
jgi:transcriptional regulator with XRE-family HTH domain